MASQKQNKVFILVNPENLEGNLFTNFVSKVLEVLKEDFVTRKLIILTAKQRNLKDQMFSLTKAKEYKLDKTLKENKYFKEIQVFNKGRDRDTFVKNSLLL